MEFEIIDIIENHARFTVEIELEDRTRKKYGYPKGEGWENKIGNEYKFEKHIREQLKAENDAEQISMTSIKNKIKGKKIKIN